METIDRELHCARMRRAIELARKAWGQTHPNPLVGALIVEAGAIVAEGWHHAAGQAHAEVEALRALGRRPASDAILYVTLEPCSTQGRTGACTDAIIHSGLQSVVVGAVDPNPAHAGAGLTRLREAGIEVLDGICGAECRDLNLIFNHTMTTGDPLIALKLAMTLDGKFSAASGQSKWVTGEVARADVMQWRRYFPAIAVSANTALADDPELTSRLGGTSWCPHRFVLDRSLKTVSAKLRLFEDANAGRTTLVCSEQANSADKALARARGLTVWELPEHMGHLDWSALRARLKRAEIGGLYVEAGPGLATALLEAGEVDYCYVYQAPKFMCDLGSAGLGSIRNTKSMSEALNLHEVVQSSLGDDRLMRGALDTKK